MGVEHESIPHKNLVGQISQATNLCKNGQVLKFRYSKQLFSSSPLFVQKGLVCFDPFLWFKAIKAQSVGEIVLITLVSKGAVVAGA